MSVSMMPGATTLTVMPRDPTSRASALASPTNPALEAAYAGDCRPPRKENSDAMLMILPDRCAIIAVAAAWPNSNAAVRFTEIIGSHLSRPKPVTSSSRQMPAELTRMSNPPSSAMHRSTMRCGIPGSVMSAASNT